MFGVVSPARVNPRPKKNWFFCTLKYHFPLYLLLQYIESNIYACRRKECLNKIYAGAKVIIPCPSVKYTFVSTYFSIELLLFLLATLIPASARADNANNSDQNVTLLASPVFGASTFGFLSSFVFAGVLASSLLWLLSPLLLSPLLPPLSLSGISTLMVQIAVKLPSSVVAVMVQVPFPTAATFPFASTVATFGSLVFRITCIGGNSP